MRAGIISGNKMQLSFRLTSPNVFHRDSGVDPSPLASSNQLIVES